MNTKTLLGLALAVCAAPAWAATIQIDFSGTIGVIDPNHHFNGVFHENDAYTGRITYDSLSQPSSTLTIGDYSSSSYGNPLSFVVNIGSYQFSAQSNPPAGPNMPAIYVQDQTAGVGNDAFLVVGIPTVPGFMTFANAVTNQMNFDFSDVSGALFSNTGLPVSVSLGQIDVSSFGMIDFGNAGQSDRARLDSNPLQTLTFTVLNADTPEPSTWLLLGSGSGLLAWLRRRSR